MADKTGIEWTDATWNPLVGCTKVSPGCDNCYAVGVVNRWHAAGKPAFPNRFDVVTMRDDKMLSQPLRWRRPRRIFVNSLSDLFHTDVPDEFIARVFAVMALASQHTFQLLTKRHARMRSLLSSEDFHDLLTDRVLDLIGDAAEPAHLHPLELRERWWPLPNLWLGVSVEDQHRANIRIPALLATPAAVRWISAEPLLRPLDLTQWFPRAGCVLWDGEPIGEDQAALHEIVNAVGRMTGIGWVVAGGESGEGARPMHPAWARDLRDQCAAAGVPFNFKQWGKWAPKPAERPTLTQTASVWLDHAEGRGVPYAHRNRDGVVELWPVGKKSAGRELDGRTHDGYPAVAR